MEKKPITAIFVLTVIFVVGYIWFYSIGSINDYILSFGILAPIVYIILMALAIVVSPIPSMPLAVMAGSMFGGFLAGLYTVIGAEMGAVIAFTIARRFGRGFVEKYLSKRVQLCDKCYKNSLPWIVFATRLLPLFQFDIVSYTAGLTNMKLWKFALATLLGMMPVTFLLTYSGQAIMFSSIWFNIVVTVVLVAGMYFIPQKLLKVD